MHRQMLHARVAEGVGRNPLDPIEDVLHWQMLHARILEGVDRNPLDPAEVLVLGVRLLLDS